MRIKKVKITKDDKVSMVYEKQTRSGLYDEYSLACSEKARPEFYKAMDKLAKHVVKMCELPDDYVSKIKVKGVSFSYAGEGEVMGATITAQMELEHSYPNLNLNTPHKASEMYSECEPDEMQLLSDDCIDDLIDLQAECKTYIKGDRAQTSLFASSVA